MARPKRGKPAAACGKRLTWEDITNRRTEPSGLVVETYLPRFTRYFGTSKQISLAGVLPEGFPGFPKPEDPSKSWCSARWDEGHLDYSLAKQYVSGKAQRAEDATADYWVLDVFDSRYTFTDYLDRLAAA